MLIWEDCTGYAQHVEFPSRGICVTLVRGADSPPTRPACIQSRACGRFEMASECLSPDRASGHSLRGLTCSEIGQAALGPARPGFFRRGKRAPPAVSRRSSQMLPCAGIAAKPRAGRPRGGMPPASWSLLFPPEAGCGFRLGVPMLLVTPKFVFDILPAGLREGLAAHLLQRHSSAGYGADI